MAGEWHCCTWGEAISLEYGKALRGHEGSTGRYRVFGSNGPIGWTDHALTQGPGVILGRKGAYRGVEFSRDPFHVIDTAYYVLPRMELDMRWLYYAVKHYRLGEIDDGSPIPSTTRAAVYVQELEIPPLPEQKRIAHILGTLDDKIELNRRMNATLEGISRAIFKSWFVDFDPVRQKAAGKQPVGMDAQTAALFPDSFEESEIGEVPKGWDVVPIPEIVEVNPGRSLRKGEVAPYLDMANIPTSGHTPDKLIARPFGSGTRFMNGDTLVARITPCLENGKTAFVDCLKSNEVAWGSTEFIVLRPYPPLPPEFAYCMARDDGFREFAIQSMTGSSGRQRVPAESLDHFQMARPSAAIAEAFTARVQPYFRRIRAAADESRTLAALRDTLLPKLLSGEIRVPEAEQAIEEVLG
jgi:type I restriction enzyme, S subunit